MAKQGRARSRRARSSSSSSSSRSRSFTSSSGSASSRSRTPPPQRRSPTGAGTKVRSPPPKKALLPGNFGEVVNAELTMDLKVNLPRGYGYVEFKKRGDAEKALQFMDGAQIDGNVVRVKFTLRQRRKASPPPNAVTAAPKREAPQKDKIGTVNEKDVQWPRESSPRHKPLSPSRRRPSPANRRADSPRRHHDSPPHRRVDSPVRRRTDSHIHRRGGTPPPRRRLASPRRHSPIPVSRRHRSPARVSPRRGRGSPFRKRSPIRARRRGRARTQKHGRSNSSSYGSPAPHKAC